ncbi:MAG: transcription termination/antitermination protein NusA, partial [Ruminococcus sp.]|nr:transcription termination/antitermination protein NusA [Ruminococcus sp.]
AKHSRITAVVNELTGEKIDIIPYSEIPEEFIAKALAPAEVLKTVITSEEEKTCVVIVPNNQLSLAIGNKGQNAKLAAKLTGFKIDIKPQFDTITGEEAPEIKPDFKLPEVKTEDDEIFFEDETELTSGTEAADEQRSEDFLTDIDESEEIVENDSAETESGPEADGE